MLSGRSRYKAAGVAGTLISTTVALLISVSPQVAGASTALQTFCLSGLSGGVQAEGGLSVPGPGLSKSEFAAMVRGSKGGLEDLRALAHQAPTPAIAASFTPLITIYTSFQTVLEKMKQTYGNSSLAKQESHYVALATADAKAFAIKSKTEATLAAPLCTGIDEAHSNAMNFGLAVGGQPSVAASGVKLTDFALAEHLVPAIKLLSYKKGPSGYITSAKVDQVIGSTTFCNIVTFVGQPPSGVEVNPC